MSKYIPHTPFNTEISNEEWDNIIRDAVDAVDALDPFLDEEIEVKCGCGVESTYGAEYDHHLDYCPKYEKKT